MVRSGLIRLLTASDESYDAHAYKAAPQAQPLGTKLVVSCKGCSVPVTVNDRGPYLAIGCEISRSGVAQELGLTQAGVGYAEYSLASQMMVITARGIPLSRSQSTLAPS